MRWVISSQTTSGQPSPQAGTGNSPPKKPYEVAALGEIDRQTLLKVLEHLQAGVRRDAAVVEASRSAGRDPRGVQLVVGAADLGASWLRWVISTLPSPVVEPPSRVSSTIGTPAGAPAHHSDWGQNSL